MNITAIKYKHNNLIPVKNDQNYVVNSVDVNNSDRSGLRYFLEILIPKAFNNPDFITFRKLMGSEKPPIDESGAVVYPGFLANISEYLNAMLSYTRPDLKNPMLQINAVKPFKIRTWVERNGVEVVGSEKTSSVKYAIKAALGEDDFPGYNNVFFGSYMDKEMPFLTHQPNGMLVSKTQPVCLSFLNNLSPNPVQLKFKAKLKFLSGKSRYIELFKIDNPVNNGIYHVPCGFEIVLEKKKIDETWYLIYPTDYHSYEVFVTDDEDKILSEIKTFRLDFHYYESERYLIFSNSLGGFDSIRATGGTSTVLKVETELAEINNISKQLSVSESNLVVLSKSGERNLVITTGQQADPDWLNYFEELVWSEEIYLVEKDLKPLVLISNQFILKADTENIGARTFEFLKGKVAVATNNLPYLEISPSASTVWMPVENYCLVGPDGKQTGYSGAGKLELYYSNVQPYVKVENVAMKDNTPGTDGYVHPVLNPGCVVGYAPYYNSLISKQGSYKKSGCALGFVGSTVLINVAAGVFGGISQKDADDLAADEWDKLNTQAAADANPDGCIISPEGYVVSVESGKAHFRFSSMRIGSAYADNYIQKTSIAGVSKGNGWGFWQPNTADVFLPGTNDIDLPVNFATDQPWRIGIYGKGSSQTTTVKIYVDAVLIKTRISTSDHFFEDILHNQIIDGSKVYILIE